MNITDIILKNIQHISLFVDEKENIVIQIFDD